MRRVRGIVGGQIFDVRDGHVRPLDIALDGSRIARLLPPGSLSRANSVLDAAGLVLLPGLIDCHVHLVMRGEDADPSVSASRSDEEIARQAAAAAERTLLGGVTTVRDVGGWNYLEMALRQEIEAGRCVGPRLVLAGRLLSRPTPAVAYYPGMYEVVEGPDTVRAAVRRQLARGADVIKVMATGAMLSPEDEDAGEVQLGPGELRAAVDEAAAEGKPVAAHAHAREGIRNAVEAGVASIEHGTHADDDVLRRMAEKATFVVPTCSPPTAMLRDEAVMREMPDHLRRRLTESRDAHVGAVRAAHRLHVPIAMGTDAGTPGNHHGQNAQECVAMVEEVGMTPEESIRAATLDAATLLRRQADLGSVEQGRYADVIGVEQDPRNDIRALMRVVLVIKGGRVIKDARSLQ